MGDDDKQEIWLIRFRVVSGPTPARSRINRVLKIADGHGLRCLGFGDPQESAQLRLEAVQLRREILELKARLEQFNRVAEEWWSER